MKLIRNVQDRGILIVDDSYTTRRCAEILLRGFGCQNIYLAENGLVGLDVLNREAASIYTIFVDILMPCIDGFGFTKMVVDRHPIPVGISILSSKDDLWSMRHFFQLSKSDRPALLLNYKCKPFTKDNLWQLHKYISGAVYARREELLAKLARNPQQESLPNFEEPKPKAAL